MPKQDPFHGLRFANLAGRVFETPLVIAEAKLRILLGVLGPRFGFDAGEFAQPIGADVFSDGSGGGETRPLYAVLSGVAVVDIFGTLVSRSSNMNALSGLLSYEKINACLDQALADPAVRAVLLRVDSGGGEVSGLFDLTDKIQALRDGDKPIEAIINDYGVSAAYMIAAATSRVTVTQTATSGSVGVITAHLDRSQANAANGIKITEIYAGSRKNDGSPNRPLADEARAHIQARVNRIYALFTAKVAAARGLDQATVMATEAAIFTGDEALAAGFADQVATFDQVIQDLAGRVAGGSFSSISMEANSMPELNDQAQAAETQANGVRALTPETPAVADLAINAAEDLHPAAARVEGLDIAASAANAERGRILGIEKAGAGISGIDKLVAEMKADGLTTPTEAATKILDHLKATGSKQLAALAADDPGKIAAAPNAGPESPAEVDPKAFARAIREKIDIEAKDGRTLSLASAAYAIQHGE